jgi:tetratricopeptide (TPR) repeat protein
MADRLRPLWDFDDLDSTERRLSDFLEGEESDAGRAEVLTQLARVEGLREEFDASERLLQQAEALAGSSDLAKVRIDLERGRKLRSSGDPAAALPLFESAFARASESGEDFLAGDALHMCAISVDSIDATEIWTQRGLDFCAQRPDAAYWAGPLLNNLGWAYYDAGDYRRALELFERALEVRLRDPENEAAIAFAREAVETAQQALS